MNRIFLVFLILSMIFISGCANKHEINDTVGVIAHGWDWDAKTQKKILSAQIALNKPGGDKFAVISQSSDTFAHASRNFSLFLPRLPIWSLASTIVIGEDLARYDMNLIADAALRNPRIRPNVYIFICKGTSANEILNVDVASEQYPATALGKIIQSQQKQANIYTPTQLRDYLFKSANAGIEPTVPQIIVYKNKDKEYLRLQGTAVFKGPKMVGSLNEKESRGLLFLNPRAATAGIMDISIPQSENNEKPNITKTVTLEILRSSADIKPIINGNKILVQIKVTADGNILEQNGNLDSTRPEVTKMFENEAKKVIKSDIKACIDQAQSLQSDIPGWGLLISRTNPRAWEQLEPNWPEIFSNINYDIQVNFEIRRSYLLQSPLEFKN